MKRLLVDTSYVLTRFSPEAIDEIFDQQGMSSTRSQKEGISTGKTVKQIATNVPVAGIESARG